MAKAGVAAQLDETSGTRWAGVLWGRAVSELREAPAFRLASKMVAMRKNRKKTRARNNNTSKATVNETDERNLHVTWP